MGLDWVLRAKAVDGKETEYRMLQDQVGRLNDRLAAKWQEAYQMGNADYDAFLDANPELALELQQLVVEKDRITISPYAVLECPRVGIDEEATKWAREFYAWLQEGGRLTEEETEEAFLTAEHGKYVPELAKNREGIGKIIGIASGPESFRGKVIGYAADIIGQELAQKAYEDMDPDEMQDYANALEAGVAGWREDNEAEIEDYLSLSGNPDTKDKANRDIGYALATCEAVLSAVVWLRFWAKHGFSMQAWY